VCFLEDFGGGGGVSSSSLSEGLSSLRFLETAAVLVAVAFAGFGLLVVAAGFLGAAFGLAACTTNNVQYVQWKQGCRVQKT
jgi:predicted benzoate:H+ symporter BenE